MCKIIAAKLFIKEEYSEKFKAEAVKLIDETRKEKGNIYYNLYEDVTNKNEFIFYEEYMDQESMEFHLNSTYLSDFSQKIKSFLKAEMVIDVLDKK